MGASIHINGTGSSVIDTVFVCRATGLVPRKWIVSCPDELAAVLRGEIEELAAGGLKVTQGDIRCVCHGHLTRLAVWNLRSDWNADQPAQLRMDAVRAWFRGFGGLESVLDALESSYEKAPSKQDWVMAGMVREDQESHDEIPF